MPMIDPQAYCIWRDNPGKKSSQPLTHAVMFCNRNCLKSSQHSVGVVKIPSQNCLKGSHISPQTWKLLKKISGTKNLNQTRLMPMIDPQAYCIWRDNLGKKSSQPLTHAVMFCNRNCLKSSQHPVGVAMIFLEFAWNQHNAWDWLSWFFLNLWKKSSQNLGHLAMA